MRQRKRPSQLRPSPTRPVSPGGAGDANGTIQAWVLRKTLMLGLVLFGRFPLLSVISCQSVARGGFVCTKLLSSASETQLFHGPGLHQDNHSEPTSLLHGLEKGNGSGTLSRFGSRGNSGGQSSCWERNLLQTALQTLNVLGQEASWAPYLHTGT